MKPVDPNKAHGQSLSNESSNGKVKTDDLKNDSDDEWEIVSESEKRASVQLPISVEEASDEDGFCFVNVDDSLETRIEKARAEIILRGLVDVGKYRNFRWIQDYLSKGLKANSADSKIIEVHASSPELISLKKSFTSLKKALKPSSICLAEVESVITLLSENSKLSTWHILSLIGSINFCSLIKIIDFEKDYIFQWLEENV